MAALLLDPATPKKRRGKRKGTEVPAIALPPRPEIWQFQSWSDYWLSKEAWDAERIKREDHSTLICESGLGIFRLIPF